MTSLKSLLRALVGDRAAPAPAAAPAQDGYKAAWNSAARADAHDAILTGATPERFEESGRGDAERVRRWLRGGDAVLNIGCGVGRVERYLAPLVGELWAIDVSGEMLARARKRLEGLPNVHLREVGNDEFLRSFEDERFDVVFSFLVLQHLEKEDAARYLRDAFRVLRPGGVFVGQFPNHLSPEYTRAFLEGLDLTARSPGRVRTYTEAEIRHTLETLGFAVEELRYGGDHGKSAEIYVAARRPASVTAGAPPRRG